jgi:hypothetical protein
MPIIPLPGGFVVQSPIHVENPNSGRRLEAWVREAGDDLVVVIGGGEKPHVGCVVLAQPRRTSEGAPGGSASCSVLTVPYHKEEPIARGIAERLANELGRLVVVTAGVHEDAIDREGIEEYLRLGDELGEKLTAELEKSQRKF